MLKKTIDIVLILLLVYLSSYAGTVIKNSNKDPLRKKIVEVSTKYLGQKHIKVGKYFRDLDCSTFLRMVLLEATGIDIAYVSIKNFPDKNLTKSYYRFIESNRGLFKEGVLKPGDLIFFDNTYDRNQNGRIDDELTHVGIVIGFEENFGSIAFIHKSEGKKVRIDYLNLSHPNISKTNIFGMDKEIILNSYLRRNKVFVNKDYGLASHLFRSFGKLECFLIRDF